MTGINLRQYSTWYYLGLLFLLASLPLSKFTMSIFQFVVLFFWLWHGVDTVYLEKFPIRSLANPFRLLHFLGITVAKVFRALILKFEAFFHNLPAMVVASLLLLHVIGLAYTSDFQYAFKDLRTKLPILILPLFIATGPRISTRIFYLLMAGYIAAVVGGSIYRLILFQQLTFADSRALGAHTSHIRFSLNAVFAVCCLMFFIGKKGTAPTWLRLSLLPVAMWLTGFLFYMNYSTGIILLSLLILFISIYLIFSIKNLYFRSITLLAGVVILLIPIFWLTGVTGSFFNKPKVDFSRLDKFTPRGNSYYHDTLNFKTYNGKWLGLYICEKELRESWPQRSNVSLDSLDPKGQFFRRTLIKYLAIKDLRKDADGIAKLSEQDIKAIENGVNTPGYNKLSSLRNQVEDFLNSWHRYKIYDDPNSSSMIQRFEYWRTSLLIIRQNPVIGVGTGDVPDAFKIQYESMQTRLAKQFRLRSHNQYLSITVAFGISGLVWFLFVMFYPGRKTKMFNNYFYLLYFIIFMLSMVTEDTIESQEGVTFYALLTALLLLGRETTEPLEKLFRLRSQNE